MGVGSGMVNPSLAAFGMSVESPPTPHSGSPVSGAMHPSALPPPSPLSPNSKDAPQHVELFGYDISHTVLQRLAELSRGCGASLPFVAAAHRAQRFSFWWWHRASSFATSFTAFCRFDLPPFGSPPPTAVQRFLNCGVCRW